MPRDASGNYTLPPENPVVSGTIITSDWANTTMPDLGNEITASLSRQGEGGMLAPLKHVQGSALLPSLTFLDDIQSGLYLSAVADVRMSIAGADVMRWTAGDVNVWDGAQWVDIPTGDEIQANYLALDASNFPTRIRFSELWAAQETGGLLDFYPSDATGIPAGGAKLNLQLGAAIESRMTLLADSGFTVLTAGDQSFDFVSTTGSQQGGFHYDDTNRFWVRTTTGDAIFDTDSGGGEFQITSRVNGNTIVISGLNGAGNERRVFDADPDAGAQLYFGATAAIRTVVNSSGGLEVDNQATGSGFERVLTTSDINTGAGDFFADGSVPMTGDLRWTSATTSAIRRVYNEANGGDLRLVAKDNGGVQRVMLDANPDAAVAFSYGSNGITARTAALSSGGLEVNVVGSGFERVLTLSDASTDNIANDSNQPQATLTDVLNNMLQYAFLTNYSLQNTQNQFYNSVVVDGIRHISPSGGGDWVTLNITCVVNQSGSGDDVQTSIALPSEWRPEEVDAVQLTQRGDSTNMFYVHCDLEIDGTFTLWQDVAASTNGQYKGSISYFIASV